MRTTILLIALVYSSLPSAFGQDTVITLKGIYQGKNLFVQNPFAGSGVGFCIYKITINGEEPPETNSAYEVDLTFLRLDIGDSVEVAIYHGNDCTPKIMNPLVLVPLSTFVIVSMNVDTNGILHWKTTDEFGSLLYIIEQFKWNKWVKIGEVEGQGLKEGNQYSFQITAGHSASNRIRVKQVDYTKRPRLSSKVTWKSNIPEVTFYPVKVEMGIYFSSETDYEVYDSFGSIVKRGFGAKIDVTNLKRGTYYINYGNKMEKFKKK